MSTTIDQRVVEMRFDNKHFEANVATTMSTLDKLKAKLNFTDSAKGLQSLSNYLNKCDFSGINHAVDTVQVKFNAMNVLSIFDQISRDETVYMATSINSSVTNNYETLPDTVMTEIEELSNILITPRINAGFMSYYSLYNPRYVFEGILHIYENMLLNDETLYDEFYLLNKLNGKCSIKISRSNDKIIFLFNTPSEAKNNYKLIINNYDVYGPYLKYIIGSIEFYQVDKESLYETQITNVSDNQG